ncbi:hypothetical protein Tco_1081714 [Tanacetum coccineum]|uniref:Uncharacterized protein n=1 Tax=Tanacetum coccineum TaxID=301880 RepID=A0ABQ5HZ86_9ASTR
MSYGEECSTTLNPKNRSQTAEQNLEEGTETGIPEAHHRTPVYSKDLRRTDPLHRSPGRGKKGVCLIDWEERSQLTSPILIGRRRSPQAKRTEVEQIGSTQIRVRTSQYSESEDSEGGHWKSRSRRQKSNTYEDDLYQPWTCEERNPFTLRIRHFSPYEN